MWQMCPVWAESTYLYDVYEHRAVFSARTQNGKLADREEIYAESDKKCTGLES